MGFDLDGPGGYFRWTAAGWADLLKCAMEYGWEPTGTGPPRGVLKADWPGAYHSNDGHLVYARDARHLAAALEQAVAAVPVRRAKSHKRASDANWLSTSEGKSAIRSFIVYCRHGSFRIH
jgi:hypothetical protein